jgi:pimeloyl-ACP methyl ester carboxylesterase
MKISDFDFFRLPFDQDGRIEPGAELDALTEHVSGGSATDVLLIAHGFRNDERDATELYTKFLRTLRENFKRPEFQDALGRRRFAIGGVFWPSQQFPESPDIDPNRPATGPSPGDVPAELPTGAPTGVSARAPNGAQGQGSTGARVPRPPADAVAVATARARLHELRDRYATEAQRPKIDRALELLPTVETSTKAQDEFVALVFTLFDGTADDPTEGGHQIRIQAGSDLLDRLGTPVVLPSGSGDVQRAGEFFGSIIGQVNQLLNFTTWYLMKDRAGVVGATGVAAAVRAIRGAAPTVKLHLVGHSLGGRMIAACAKSLANEPAVRLDSFVVLEGAFSHYGFSKDNGRGTAGFFRDVVARKIVKGPMLATYSIQDTVVGLAYAIASRLAGDNARAIGDAGDEFGGIGRNGTQKTDEAVQDVLHAVGTAYRFTTGVVTNLDGSGGLIKDHGDVANAAVTYAVASALARS